MAPRKEKDAKDGAKAERITGSEAADLVLKYLQDQNRPYSANDISANLHNKVTKTAATKLLKDLADKDLLICRASGKQLVYHTPQPTGDVLATAATLSPSHLASLDTQTATLKAKTASALAETKTLKSRLAALGATAPLSELRASVQELQDEVERAQARVATLRDGGAVPVCAEERQRLDATARKWDGAEKARRKIVAELWGVIVEHIADGEALAELRERLGLDE